MKNKIKIIECPEDYPPTPEEEKAAAQEFLDMVRKDPSVLDFLTEWYG